VRDDVSVIFDKLRVNGRSQAIVWARDAGFGRKPSCEPKCEGANDRTIRLNCFAAK